MSGYKRFDRHEVFEMSDTSFVLDCIQDVNKHDYENGGAELSNMLFGAQILSISMFEKLEDILVKIDDSLIHVMDMDGGVNENTCFVKIK